MTTATCFNPLLLDEITNFFTAVMNIYTELPRELNEEIKTMQAFLRSYDQKELFLIQNFVRRLEAKAERVKYMMKSKIMNKDNNRLMEKLYHHQKTEPDDYNNNNNNFYNNDHNHQNNIAHYSYREKQQHEENGNNNNNNNKENEFNYINNVYNNNNNNVDSNNNNKYKRLFNHYSSSSSSLESLEKLRDCYYEENKNDDNNKDKDKDNNHKQYSSPSLEYLPSLTEEENVNCSMNESLSFLSNNNIYNNNSNNVQEQNHFANIELPPEHNNHVKITENNTKDINNKENNQTIEINHHQSHDNEEKTITLMKQHIIELREMMQHNNLEIMPLLTEFINDSSCMYANSSIE